MGDEKERYDGLQKPHVSAPTPHPPAPKRRTPLNNIKTTRFKDHGTTTAAIEDNMTITMNSTHMQRSAPNGRHYPPPPQCGNPPKNPETNTTRAPRVGSVGAVSINKDKRPETPNPKRSLYIYICTYVYVCVYSYIHSLIYLYSISGFRTRACRTLAGPGIYENRSEEAETPAGGQGRFRHPLLQGPTAFHENSGKKSGI